MATIKPVKADEFKGKDGIYRFPFEVLDKTPGESNLGRIEWGIEPLRGKKTGGRYMIEGILIWARQTRDERYAKKIFYIECFSESITADIIERKSYLSYVWRTMFCEEHKNLIFDAYPANNHSILEINVESSISIDINFK